MNSKKKKKLLIANLIRVKNIFPHPFTQSLSLISSKKKKTKKNLKTIGKARKFGAYPRGRLTKIPT